MHEGTSSPKEPEGEATLEERPNMKRSSVRHESVNLLNLNEDERQGTNSTRRSRSTRRKSGGSTVYTRRNCAASRSPDRSALGIASPAPSDLTGPDNREDRFQRSVVSTVGDNDVMVETTFAAYQ